MAKRHLPCPTVLRLLLRYEPETGKLFWNPRGAVWFRPAGKHSADGRARIWNGAWAGKEALAADMTGGYRGGMLFNKGAVAHQVAWAIYHGRRAPSALDHVNGDRTDNRIANLREAEPWQNNLNRSAWRNAASRHRGVYPMPNGRWRARINEPRGRTLSLGIFGTEQEAAMAYNEAARRLHGKWAKLNTV